MKLLPVHGNDSDDGEDIETVDPEKIAAIVCKHCPDWSHAEIRQRVLEVLGNAPNYVIKGASEEPE